MIGWVGAQIIKVLALVGRSICEEGEPRFFIQIKFFVDKYVVFKISGQGDSKDSLKIEDPNCMT